MEAVKKLKEKAIDLLTMGFVVLVMAPVFWAVGIVGLQLIGWMQHAAWQPVPFSAMWLSEAGQLGLRVDYGVKNALTIVPSWGSAESAGALVQSLAGNAAGLALIVAWVLDTPLVVWILAAVFGVVYTAQDYVNSR